MLSRNKSVSKTEVLLAAERAKSRVLLDGLRVGKVDIGKVLYPHKSEEDSRLNIERARSLDGAAETLYRRKASKYWQLRLENVFKKKTAPY